MMNKLDRREFLRRTALSAATGAVLLSGVGKAARLFAANEKGKPYATMIDLSRCTGCETCVKACRGKNASRYPEPAEEILPYWPQKNYEDWSGERERTDRLTPYNWLYIQRVEVEKGGKIISLNIPRRCMHCENPPCANLCPFGVIEKTEEGAVAIDVDYCFGGAKCRDICPWSIPQRQAGTGLYLKIAPKFAGGGVMYKCDFCQDRIAEGKAPACAAACPEGAVSFDSREKIIERVEQRAKEIQGYIYGARENGGTLTYYVSPVPFETINEAINQTLGQGHPGMTPDLENPLDSSTKNLLLSMAVAPVAGAMAAGISAYKKLKGENKDDAE